MPPADDHGQAIMAALARTKRNGEEREMSLACESSYIGSDGTRKVV